MIDSHAHVSAQQFDTDRIDVIARCRDVGVRWIEVGTNLADSKKALEFPYASVGVHPNSIAGLTDTDWEELASLAEHGNCYAIGEVGLDFSRGGNLEDQQIVLKRFIALAQIKNLPMIFHVRSGNGIDAHLELIRILKEYVDTDRPAGVIHTFSGTIAQAQKYVALGMMISFSGVITFKNAGELPEVAKTIPLENILAETDCPFLTPEPHRGKRNEPMYVKYVIQKIAELRGLSFEEIEQATEQTAKRLFGI